MQKLQQGIDIYPTISGSKFSGFLRKNAFANSFFTYIFAIIGIEISFIQIKISSWLFSFCQ